MQKTRLRKFLSLILCIVLIAATALFAYGCSDNNTSPTGQDTTTAISTETTTSADEDSNVLGEGQRYFTFTVVDAEGKEEVFEIHTDKEIVGDALTELGLISGDQGDYGLYVKTVHGITVDYDTDQKYWAFYVNDEYALSGVDTTEIEDGASYSFKVE